MELQEELVRGISVEDLRTKLNKRSDGHQHKVPSVQKTKSEIPDDLVQLQAYLRWEKAGKPYYSPEEQLVIFLSLLGAC